MRLLPNTLLAVTCAVTCAVPATAQDGVVYYKFDATDTTQVLNHAHGASAGPRFGTTSWPANLCYTTGQIGHALQRSGLVGLAGKFVETGVTGPIAGSMTIAFALRNGGANSSATYSPIAGQPSWSIATGGSAGSGLQLHGTGVGDVNGDFGAPLCSLPGWNHFAVVVDAAAGTARWYGNGALVSSQPISGGVQIAAQQALRVGTDYVTHCGGLYDIDEFRLLDRAASATEIAAWANGTAATAVPFGAATAVALAANQTPQLGNPTFALVATAPNSLLVAFAFGSSYAQFGGTALPLSLNGVLPGPAGQLLLVAPEGISVAATQDGVATLPLPVPANTQLLGRFAAVQAIALLGDGQFRTGNALLVSPGTAQ